MVIELKVKAYTMKSVSHIDALNEIAAMIDNCLCENEEFRQLHNSKAYKPYSFSSLWPISQNGLYKQDNFYTFIIRTLDGRLASFLMDRLRHTETDCLKGLLVECREIKRKHITKLYSLTPVVLKMGPGKGYWRDTISLDEYEKLIFDNLMKKANYFYNTKIDEGFEFWTKISILNKKPIISPYKGGIGLLGDKLELEIAENESAQKLAYIALATSIGHNCSRGNGFVNFHTVE